MMNIPPELRNAIYNDELIIFVGAGLSYDLKNIKGQKLGGWGNLVKCILEDLKEKGYDVDILVPLLDRYEPIKVLELIESDTAIEKREIYAFIKKFIDLDQDNNLEIHKKLFQLSRKIITTNYDTSFENAVPELRKNTAYKGKNYELTTHKDPNSALLFKLHGCFEDVDSMVLFPSNYKSLYEGDQRDAQHSLFVLKNIILNKSLLFIGTGMGDFQINNLFKEVKKLQGEYNQKHFVVTNKTLDSSLDFLTPLPIEDHSEIEHVIEYLVSIKEEFKQVDTAEIDRLRNELDEANAKIEQFERTGDKGVFIEKVATKCFASGVEFSLNNNFTNAIILYEIAVELKPEYHQAWFNWGTDLGNIAETKNLEKAEIFYEQAFLKYEKAIKVKPDKHEAWYNWGTDLGKLADTKSSTQAEVLYEQACLKFEKAVELKPEYHQAWYNWGIVLGKIADTKNPEQAEVFFKQSLLKYEKAVAIEPNKYEAWYNWGIDLGKMARTKNSEEAEMLYEQAILKYEKAVEVRPDKHKAWYNCAIILGKIANTKSSEEAEMLYEQAILKYEKAVELGGNPYNLSCLYALKGEKSSALKYLELTLSKAKIEVQYVEKDEDWKAYLTDKDFQELLNKYRE